MSARNPRVQRFAQLCRTVASDHRRLESESERAYLLRVRRLAEKVQQQQRAGKRKAARNSRKRNR